MERSGSLEDTVITVIMQFVVLATVFGLCAAIYKLVYRVASKSKRHKKWVKVILVVILTGIIATCLSLTLFAISSSG